MGFNTTVVVMNDALHAIAEDKNFGKTLADKVIGVGFSFKKRSDLYVPAMNHVNAAHVIETHHSDGMHAVLTGGNCGSDLGYVGGYTLDETTEDGKRNLLRQLAANLGFDIKLTKRAVAK